MAPGGSGFKGAAWAEQNGGVNRIHRVKITKINKLIHAVRSERVMFDRDLAALYEVETKTLNRAIQSGKS